MSKLKKNVLEKLIFKWIIDTAFIMNCLEFLIMKKIVEIGSILLFNN